MHYFLSGTSGVGKSTVIAKVLERLGDTLQGEVGGFVTQFDAPRGQATKTLSLMPATALPVSTTPLGTQQNALRGYQVAVCTPEGPATVYPALFDKASLEYLPDAPAAPLIIMDECGRIERHAHEFQRRVLQTLAGQTPVLGVLCYKPSDFTRAIAAHPQVTVIEVTTQNRDALPAQLAATLMHRTTP